MRSIGIGYVLCVPCVLMVASGCFHPSYDHPACSPKGECPSGLTCSTAGICEGPDVPGDDGGTCTSFATQVDTCKLAFGGDLMLSGSKLAYNTDTHVLTVDGTTMAVPHMTLATKVGSVDVIFGHNVRLMANAVLRATGMLPFGIVASGSLTLEDGALIDVSAGGAGALQLCGSVPMPGSDNTGGAGGGGGAGYAASGGDGGSGNLDGTLAPGGQKSGSIAMPDGPLGGCPGAQGGSGDSPGGAGGSGGGAFYVEAADRIELLGFDTLGAMLTAGGGGGHGGTAAVLSSNGAGGGGGGSGGMIWLESPHIFGPQSTVAANGGGGGEGSSKQQAGRDGAPGSLTASRAFGGTGGASEGVDGGRGGSLEEPTGETVTARLNSGGGGGGGGVGYIHIVSGDVQLGLISPAPQ